MVDDQAFRTHNIDLTLRDFDRAGQSFDEHSGHCSTGSNTHFYRAFVRIRSNEKLGRTAVFRKLLERIGEIHSDDGFIAFKNVYLSHNSGTIFVNNGYDAFREGVRTRAKANIPYHMAIAMLLRPLDLSPAVRRTVVPPAVWIAHVLTTDPFGR